MQKSNFFTQIKFLSCPDATIFFIHVHYNFQFKHDLKHCKYNHHHSRRSFLVVEKTNYCIMENCQFACLKFRIQSTFLMYIWSNETTQYCKFAENIWYLQSQVYQHRSYIKMNFEYVKSGKFLVFQVLLHETK